MMGLMTGDGMIGTTLRRFNGGGGASATTYMQTDIRLKSSNQVVKLSSMQGGCMWMSDSNLALCARRRRSHCAHFDQLLFVLRVQA